MPSTQSQRPTIARPLSAQAYLSSHEAFRSSSDQGERIVEWFESSGLLEHSGDVPSVLSVGAGGGDIDALLIEQLDQRNDAFGYDALDPNRSALERFRERCTEMSPHLANRIWLYEGNFQSFEPHHRYDLIHIVHTVYASGDPREMVEKAYRHLAPGGKMGVICSTDHGVNRFKARAFAEIDLPGRASTVPEAELLDALGCLSGAQLEIELLPSEIDVTSAMEPDRAGERLLSFFLQTDFPALTTGEQIAVLQALAEEAVADDGRYFIRQPMLCVAVTKNSVSERGRVSLNVRDMGSAEIADLSY